MNLWKRAQNEQYVVLSDVYVSDNSLLRYKQRITPNGIMQFCVGNRIIDSPVNQALIEKRAAWECAQGNPWAPPTGFSQSIADERSLTTNDERYAL